MFDVTKGAEIAYRSFAGDTYEAIVVNVDAKRVDINVLVPGMKADDGKMFLRAIRWYDDPKEPSPGARPRKEGAHG